MTTFVSCPIVLAPKQNHAALLSAGGTFVTRIRHADCRMVTSCRMRNKGGFHLPPLVPSERHNRQRAIELLGNFTQRRGMKQSAAAELQSLVGELPGTKEIAQQWKAMLQKNPRRKQHKDNPSAFKRRRVLLDKIRLPERESLVGRCFVLLGCLQRRYRLNQPPSPLVLRQLEDALGSYPVDKDETHHYISALAVMQKERRSREKRPPRVPTEDMAQLALANMLLGSFAARGSVGRQEQRLLELIGEVPRNTNVAASWQKVVAAAIRKMKRKEKTARRRAEIDQKRIVRKLRKQQKELQRSLLLAPEVAGDDRTEENCSSPFSIGKFASQAPSISTSVEENGTEASFPYFKRLQRMLETLFGI